MIEMFNKTDKLLSKLNYERDCLIKKVKDENNSLHTKFHRYLFNDK